MSAAVIAWKYIPGDDQCDAMYDGPHGWHVQVCGPRAFAPTKVTADGRFLLFPEYKTLKSAKMFIASEIERESLQGSGS